MPTPTKPSEREPVPLGSPLDPRLLLHPITSGSLTIVKGHQGAAGLILDRHFTADLVLFGGAVGVSIDRDTEQVIPIGPVILVPPRSYLEKQWAFRRRVYWLNWQQQITEAYPAGRRAEILISRLSEQFSREQIQPLSDQILAKLVGVSPAEVALARDPDWALRA